MKRLLRRNRPMHPLPTTDATLVCHTPPNLATSTTRTLSNHHPTTTDTPRPRRSNPFAAVLQSFLRMMEEFAREIDLRTIEDENRFNRIEADIAQLREDISTGIERSLREILVEEREIQEIRDQNAHCARYCLRPLRGPNGEAIPATIKFPQNTHELAVFTEGETNDLASFYQLDIPPNSPLALRMFCILSHLGVNV